MRWRDVSLVALLALAACGGGGDDGSSDAGVTPPGGPADRLLGNWTYVDAQGGFGVGFSFKPGAAYSFYTLNTTSPTAAKAQVTNGTFSATETAVTLSAAESTCAGRYAPETIQYTVSSSSLSVTLGTTVFNLPRNTQAADGSFLLSLGCFQSDGSFLASPLQPVSN